MHATPVLLSTLALAALASCGGGSSSGAPSAPPTPAAPTLSAIQGPECIADTAGRWASVLTAGQPESIVRPVRKFYLATRYVGPVDTPIRTNFGHLAGLPVTNFDPEAGVQAKDYGRWQRGRVDGDAGSISGFQMKCDGVGSFIDTGTFLPQALLGTGPHSSYFFDFRDDADPLSLSKLPAVYDSNPDSDFLLEAMVEVPWLQRSGPADDPATGALAVAQVSLAAYVRDSHSGKMFAYAVMLYQNRAREAALVAQDEEVAYVSTPFETNEFVTLPPQSAGFTSATWTGLKLFRIHVPQAKFRLALAKVNAFCAAAENRARSFCSATFSSDPADYQLVAFGTLHEVFTGPANRVSTGVHFKAVGAYRAR